MYLEMSCEQDGFDHSVDHAMVEDVVTHILCGAEFRSHFQGRPHEWRWLLCVHCGCHFFQVLIKLARYVITDVVQNNHVWLELGVIGTNGMVVLLLLPSQGTQ